MASAVKEVAPRTADHEHHPFVEPTERAQRASSMSTDRPPRRARISCKLPRRSGLESSSMYRSLGRDVRDQVRGPTGEVNRFGQERP